MKGSVAKESFSRLKSTRLGYEFMECILQRPFFDPKIRKRIQHGVTEILDDFYFAKRSPLSCFHSVAVSSSLHS